MAAAGLALASDVRSRRRGSAAAGLRSFSALRGVAKDGQLRSVLLEERPRTDSAGLPPEAAEDAGQDASEVSLARTNEVEESLKQFVPKIAALKHHAEMLRTEELRHVIDTMKESRKGELVGVFGQLDSLLCALVTTVDGLKNSAMTLRNSDLRQEFFRIDHEAQAWVGRVERNTVESLTGFKHRSYDEVDTMMEVHVMGLSHHKATVDVREKLAVDRSKWNAYVQALVEFSRTDDGFLVQEAAVLSTCNRFEVYFASRDFQSSSAIECLRAFLVKQSGIEREELDQYLFEYSGDDAVRHLFSVSSGLDSLVLGEAQILAQVKACHIHAISKAGFTTKEGDELTVDGSGGKIVAKMLNAAIRVGKLVRTKTRIGKGSVSISSAAVELVLAKSLPELKKYSSNLRICVLGAGRMVRLLLLALFSKQPDIRVVVVNRSVDKAKELLEEVKGRGGSRAEVVGSEMLEETLKASDVVFTATSSKDPIISKADLVELERKLMLVDISVPRNIAADCAEVPGVVSYSVDDLKKVQEQNNMKRQKEAAKAHKFVDEEVGKFLSWNQAQGAVPYLAALQTRAEAIRKEEQRKMAKKLKGLHEKERRAVDKLTRHIIDKMLRPIYYSMKEREDKDSKVRKIIALKELYGLEPEYKRRALPAAPSAPQLSA